MHRLQKFNGQNRQGSLVATRALNLEHHRTSEGWAPLANSVTPLRVGPKKDHLGEHRPLGIF